MNNYRYPFLIIFIVIISIFTLVGCRSETNDAPKTIEAYIKALSNQDANQISSLSCADWEPQALIEVDSFTAVSSEVKDLACQQSGQDGDDVYVSCTGILALDYGGEAQQIDLSSRTYIARQEGGEWHMCGYH
ncbi:MAG TPA: hypothetical protein VF831_07195 [Anaerolineales bacterium]